MYNLANDIDREVTKIKINEYQEAYRDEIVANKARDLDMKRMIEQVGEIPGLVVDYNG